MTTYRFLLLGAAAAIIDVIERDAETDADACRQAAAQCAARPSCTGYTVWQRSRLVLTVDRTKRAAGS